MRRLNKHHLHFTIQDGKLARHSDLLLYSCYTKSRSLYNYTCDTAHMSEHFAYAKTKAQISFTVTAKLISVFVFATRIVQFLYFLNPTFLASNLHVCLYSSICVGPVRKPHCWFSHDAAHMTMSVFSLFSAHRHKT